MAMIKCLARGGGGGGGGGARVHAFCACGETGNSSYDLLMMIKFIISAHLQMPYIMR